MTYTSLEQSQALAKGVTCETCLGSGKRTYHEEASPESCRVCNGDGVERYPQDQWPQLVWMDVRGDARMMLAYLTAKPSNGYPWHAAPHPLDALLWVLRTAAWKAKHGDRWTLCNDDGSKWYLYDFRTALAWENLDATLSDLLDAMLAEVV